MSGGIVFYGDPHGSWRPLLRACSKERPDCVVILGDCDLTLPFRQQLWPLFDLGIPIRWIHGNHDTDTEALYDFLWGDYPEGDLHGWWEKLGGLIVAGLGGIYKERIWYPRYDLAEPIHTSRRDYVRQTLPRHLWRGRMPLAVRDAIFPEDMRTLRTVRADVLVTHEAPTTHRHGFAGIDEAARLCRARMVVHGHHHESYRGTLPGGARVQGLAKAEVLRIRPEDLA